MRILEFDVNRQQISRSQGCDFSGLVAGTVNYLKAKFYFSHDDWNGCKKAASFWVGEREYSQLLDNDECCFIPKEALVGKTFRVSVTGARENFNIKTNKVKVRQEV